MGVWLPVQRVCLESLIARTLLKSVSIVVEPDSYGTMSPTPHRPLHDFVIHIGFLVGFKRRAVIVLDWWRPTDNFNQRLTEEMRSDINGPLARYV